MHMAQPSGEEAAGCPAARAAQGCHPPTQVNRPRQAPRTLQISLHYSKQQQISKGYVFNRTAKLLEVQGTSKADPSPAFRQARPVGGATLRTAATSCPAPPPADGGKQPPSPPCSHLNHILLENHCSFGWGTRGKQPVTMTLQHPGSRRQALRGYLGKRTGTARTRRGGSPQAASRMPAHSRGELPGARQPRVRGTASPCRILPGGHRCPPRPAPRHAAVPGRTQRLGEGTYLSSSMVRAGGAGAGQAQRPGPGMAASGRPRPGPLPAGAERCVPGAPRRSDCCRRRRSPHRLLLLPPPPPLSLLPRRACDRLRATAAVEGGPAAPPGPRNSPAAPGSGQRRRRRRHTRTPHRHHSPSSAARNKIILWPAPSLMS